MANGDQSNLQTQTEVRTKTKVDVASATLIGLAMLAASVVGGGMMAAVGFSTATSTSFSWPSPPSGCGYPIISATMLDFGGCTSHPYCTSNFDNWQGCGGCFRGPDMQADRVCGSYRYGCCLLLQLTVGGGGSDPPPPNPNPCLNSNGDPIVKTCYTCEPVNGEAVWTPVANFTNGPECMGDYQRCITRDGLTHCVTACRIGGEWVPTISTSCR